MKSHPTPDQLARFRILCPNPRALSPRDGARMAVVADLEFPPGSDDYFRFGLWFGKQVAIDVYAAFVSSSRRALLVRVAKGRRLGPGRIRDFVAASRVMDKHADAAARAEESGKNWL